MKLSNNFSLSEFTDSNTAERRGIDNSPTAEHIHNMVALCENVLQITGKSLILFGLIFFTINIIQALLTDLHGDEAYYWRYSQDLDWGYFDNNWGN